MKRKRNLVSFLVQKVKMQSHLLLLSGISKDRIQSFQEESIG